MRFFHFLQFFPFSWNIQFAYVVVAPCSWVTNEQEVRLVPMNSRICILLVGLFVVVTEVARGLTTSRRHLCYLRTGEFTSCSWVIFHLSIEVARRSSTSRKQCCHPRAGEFASMFVGDSSSINKSCSWFINDQETTVVTYEQGNLLPVRG